MWRGGAGQCAPLRDAGAICRLGARMSDEQDGCRCRPGLRCTSQLYERPYGACVEETEQDIDDAISNWMD